MLSSTQMKFVVASAALAFVSSIHAQTYGQLQPEHSQVAFTFEQMGVRMDGQFREFDAKLQFDPDSPAQGSAEIHVALGSVDLGSPDFDSEALSSDWFNAANFPTATFTSSVISQTAENLYDVSGTLTIKGQSQTITVPASFQKDGEKGIFEGQFTIERGQFSIGEGSWAKYDIVANDVTVKFQITALPN